MIEVDTARLIRDIDKIQARLRGLPRALEECVRDAIAKYAAQVVESAQQLVPVDTGALRDSISVVVKNESEVWIVASMEYALYVHEDLRAYHPRGQAKFVEIPFMLLPQSVREEVERTYPRYVRALKAA